MRVKAIFPFTFSIQWEKLPNLSVARTRTLGNLQHTWKSARALTFETSGNSEQTRQRHFKGPMKGLSHFKPHTLPLAPKWKWLQVWISSKVTAEPAALSSCDSEKLGAAAPVEHSPSCKLQPGPHTTAEWQQISRPNGGKKRTIRSKKHFFSLISLYCPGRTDRRSWHLPHRTATSRTFLGIRRTCIPASRTTYPSITDSSSFSSHGTMTFRGRELKKTKPYNKTHIHHQHTLLALSVIIFADPPQLCWTIKH